jgi:hypothetical protein
LEDQEAELVVVVEAADVVVRLYLFVVVADPSFLAEVVLPLSGRSGG